MSDQFSDILDNAINRYSTGESMPEILTAYPEHATELMQLLQTARVLEKSGRPIVALSKQAEKADRAAFLRQIQGLPETNSGLLASLSLWIGNLPEMMLTVKNRLQIKEWSPMSMIVVRVALAVVLLFGAVGGTAVAAADSLPDSPLYSVKTAVEDIRIGLTNDPIDQAHLQLVLAQTRIQEMVKLAQNGGEPGEATLTRLQNHLETALQLAANAPEDRMNGVLTQAQLMLQGEGPGMLQAQQQVQGPAHDALGNAYQIMNQIGKEIEVGLQNPQVFRWRYMHNRPEGLPEPPVMEPNPGGVITHTMPISHTRPITPSRTITEPVQAGPGYGPGEPFYGPGAPGGNPVSPYGPNPEDAPGYGPGEQPGYGPGETPGAGLGPSQSNSPADSGSDSPGPVDAGNPNDNGGNDNSGGSSDNGGSSDSGGGGDNGGGNGGGGH